MDQALTPVQKYGGFQIREDDCSYVWYIAREERCEWVTNQSSCLTDSVLQYGRLLFCGFPDSSTFPLGLCLLFLWLLYLFLILGTTADNFFCPSLSVIAGVLRLSENIAGVTILAFGNGAPDIFTSMVSDEDEMVIMFTELIGAGIFVTAVIAGSVVFVSPFRIPFNAFMRDCCFYIISVCWICYVSEDGIIHIWEALSLILLYILFIVVVVAMQFYETKEEKLKGRIPYLQDPELLKTYVAYRADHTRSEDCPREELTLRPRAYSLRAKLDVAIATELAMQRRMKGTATETTTAGLSNDEADDTLPPSRRPKGLFWEFLYDINPITAQDWKNGSIYVKTILVLRAPVTFFLQCLIPVVNETAEKRGWSKLLNCLQLVVTPVAALVKLQECRIITGFISGKWIVIKINYNNMILRRNQIAAAAATACIGPVPIVLPVFILGLALATYVFMRTEPNRCPKYHNGFAFLGFLSAMLVVYVIASEVMAVLECVGYAGGISDAMLGITLLAWGNSVGDLISNIAVAKRGFPRMGYSACFGGPLFNTLLGLGISWTFAAVEHDNYRAKIRTSDMMPGCLTFLLASLVASLTYLNISGFLARRSYGLMLFSLYFTFLLLNILSEVHFIHPLGTDHRED